MDAGQAGVGWGSGTCLCPVATPKAGGGQEAPAEAAKPVPLKHRGAGPGWGRNTRRVGEGSPCPPPRASHHLSRPERAPRQPYISFLLSRLHPSTPVQRGPCSIKWLILVFD